MVDILSLLSERPIAYHRSLIRKFGLAPGVFLGQLLYWQGKGSKREWIYKTQEEMKEETGLTRRNQETARKTLINKGVLQEELRGLPAKLHYKVNLTVLSKCLGISSMAEPSKLDCTNRANSDGGTEQTITKNTQEITTKKDRAAPVAPQVKLFREITERYPQKALYIDVVNLMGENPDPVRARAAYKAWLARGYNPHAITWLEWYRDGIPQHVTFKSQAELNRGGRGNGVVI